MLLRIWNIIGRLIRWLMALIIVSLIVFAFYDHLTDPDRQALTLLMATLRKPSILLLDEHTAALDPKTGARVLDLTRQLIEENNLTTLMITHNMREVIQYGNRLIMMHAG